MDFPSPPTSRRRADRQQPTWLKLGLTKYRGEQSCGECWSLTLESENPTGVRILEFMNRRENGLVLMLSKG